MAHRPNLLFIYTDQQAISSLGCYGNPVIATPNLDRLAERSVVFDNCYVTQPLCTPSRGSLLCGLYPHSAGLFTNNIPLSLDIPCLPEIGDFRAYSTCHNGKWHLGDEIFPQHGFQEWMGTEDGYRRYWRDWRDKDARSPYFHFLIESGFQPDAKLPDGTPAFGREYSCQLPEEYSKPAFQATEACRYIRSHAEEPFVLYVNFLEPHQPYFGSRDDQYPPESVVLPPNYVAAPTEDQPLRQRLLAVGRWETDIDSGPIVTEQDWRQLIARYWGNVSLVDTYVGQILDTLNNCGLDEQTIIVFTSDHGDMMGSHKMAGKCTMFEESAKVPFMLRVPGEFDDGRRIAPPVSQIDVLPTLLDLMGQPVPAHVQGYSWVPFLRDEEELVERNVFIEWNGPENGIVGGTGLGHNSPPCWLRMASDDEIVAAITDPVRTIVTPEGWKYTWSTLGEDELYDLNADPGETVNLATGGRHQEFIGKLRSHIIDWQRRTKDTVTF
jgi:arylsulfatase A-like enzyme